MCDIYLQTKSLTHIRPPPWKCVTCLHLWYMQRTDKWHLGSEINEIFKRDQDWNWIQIWFKETFWSVVKLSSWFQFHVLDSIIWVRLSCCEIKLWVCLQLLCEIEHQQIQREGACQPADKANSGPASLQLSSALLVSLWEKFAVWGIIGRRMFSLEIALH